MANEYDLGKTHLANDGEPTLTVTVKSAKDAGTYSCEVTGINGNVQFKGSHAFQVILDDGSLGSVNFPSNNVIQENDFDRQVAEMRAQMARARAEFERNAFSYSETSSGSASSSSSITRTSSSSGGTFGSISEGFSSNNVDHQITDFNSRVADAMQQMEQHDANSESNILDGPVFNVHFQGSNGQGKYSGDNKVYYVQTYGYFFQVLHIKKKCYQCI